MRFPTVPLGYSETAVQRIRLTRPRETGIVRRQIRVNYMGGYLPRSNDTTITEGPVSDRPAGSRRNPAIRIFRRAWGFLKGQVILDVPDDDAPCEFNCRVNQCTLGEWETCESRLRTLARKTAPSEPPNAAGAT